jgi:hypothetical protein
MLILILFSLLFPVLSSFFSLSPSPLFPFFLQFLPSIYPSQRSQQSAPKFNQTKLSVRLSQTPGLSLIDSDLSLADPFKLFPLPFSGCIPILPKPTNSSTLAQDNAYTAQERTKMNYTVARATYFIFEDKKVDFPRFFAYANLADLSANCTLDDRLAMASYLGASALLLGVGNLVSPSEAIYRSYTAPATLPVIYGSFFVCFFFFAHFSFFSFFYSKHGLTISPFLDSIATQKNPTKNSGCGRRCQVA